MRFKVKAVVEPQVEQAWPRDVVFSSLSKANERLDKAIVREKLDEAQATESLTERFQ